MFSFGTVVSGLTWAIGAFDNKELAFAISLVILALAIAIAVHAHIWRHRPFVRPIRRLASDLGKVSGQGGEAEARIAAADKVLTSAPRAIASLWREYKKHLVSDPKSGGYVNLVDPRLWFSLESLPGRGYEHWCATWAGVFLTVGLLFTFIGLSAALLKVGGIDAADSVKMKDAITGILGVSSAKFITSIAGILAYIGFSLITRRYQSSQQEAVRALADAIQHLSLPLTPELLLFEQNDMARKQLNRLDRFTDDLAIAIDGKLKERLGELTAAMEKQLGDVRQDLPGATAQPIVEAVGGIAEKIGQGNEKGMKEMLDAFLDRLQGGAGDKMAEAAARLAEAAKQMGEVKDGIGGAGQTFGNDIKGAADALREAADKLTQGGAEAGTKLKESTDAAGMQFKETLDAVGRKLDTIGGTLAGIPGNIDTALNETLNKLTAAIDALVDRLTRSGEEGGDALRKGGEEAGTGLKNAVDRAGRDFDTTLNQATQNLVTQLMDSLGKLEGKIGDFADWLAMTESSFEKLRGSVALQVTNLSAAGQTFTTAVQTVTKAGDALRQAASPLQQTATAIQDSLGMILKGIGEAEAIRRQTQQDVREALDGLKATAEAAQRTFETHEKRFGAVDQALVGAIDRVRTGVEEITRTLNDAFGRYDEHIAKAVQSLGQGVEDLSDAIESLADTKPQPPPPPRRF